MKKIIYILSIIFMLTACTGSNSNDSNNSASRQPKRAHELRFLRDLGINPDSMLVDDRWVMPDDEDWETKHNRWLDMNRIQSLGLDQLCDADTDNSPITIIAVHPVDENYTMLIFHQYLGDSAPFHLVTYDGDGVPMDHLDLGPFTGANLRYWNEEKKAIGVEKGDITFNDRMMTVNRELKLIPHGTDNALWKGTNADIYEIDNKGYIMHRDATAQLDQMDESMRSQRRLEAAGWYSLQDEQAMDALSACFAENPSVSNFMGMTLFLRLNSSPWTTAHWLYTHQDSPLIPALAKEMKEMDREMVTKVLEPVRDADQHAFMEKLISDR